MNRILKYLSIFCLLTCISCERLLIEPAPKSSPEQNFEILWSDFNNTYPFFSRDEVDWQEVYDQYRTQVTENTTNNQLFDIFSQMLSNLSDGHLSLTNTDGTFWANPKPYNQFITYLDTLIFRNYLNNNPKLVTWPNPDNKAITEIVADYGIINNDKIYYHLRTFNTDYPFDKLLDSLNNTNPNAKGLILDLRDNGGGDLNTMGRLVGMFFTQKITYAYFEEKIGPLENNYRARQDFNIFPNNQYSTFQKPVVVLTDRRSASASEHAVLALKKRANTTIVGDSTSGALSFIIQRTLPNGMQYTTVNSRTFDTDGNLYESIGIPPQIYQLLYKESVDAGKDDLIEKALSILN